MTPEESRACGGGGTLPENMRKMSGPDCVHCVMEQTVGCSTPSRPLSPQEHQDPEGPGDVLDLDVDELSQHECMAPLVALVQHMQRLEAALPAEEVFLLFLVSPWLTVTDHVLLNERLTLKTKLNSISYTHDV